MDIRCGKISDVARQALSTSNDPALQNKLAKALAERNYVNVDPRMKERGTFVGGYDARQKIRLVNDNSRKCSSICVLECASRAAEQEAAYEVSIQDA